ncbi:hypothetical protein KM911_14995 [Bacillus paralicheniformis]|uniref:hypothetical protein n=1 Tax=Bacillus TaxID=1386 RepID=UPI001C23684E|nr:hypothetical protein [Bacillus paralicheniformis]MBU8583011.1 hypothetical protein [Bacillus paralicheniformis]
MDIVITMSNKDYFTLIDYKDMQAVEEFVDYLHYELDGKQVLKNQLIQFNESVLFNPSQITSIEIKK